MYLLAEDLGDNVELVMNVL